jgi:transcriptional regulator with XRE-family HTH domain
MNKIGQRLRELRQQKGLTLQQVVEETGFALSYLSQLERDKVSISVDNLERLANYYEVHMVHFFRAAEETPIQVIKKSEIQENMTLQGESQAAVAFLGNRADARLEPLLIKISPGGEEPHFRSHDADTLLYILEGEAEVLSEKGDLVHLESGDMAYYQNFPRKRLRNPNPEKPLLVIAIHSPPTTSLDEMINMRQAAVKLPGISGDSEK